MYEANIVLSAILYCFSIYFLQNEIRQIIMGPLDYFKSIWNYSDLVPPCFIIAIVSMHLKRNMCKLILLTIYIVPEDGSDNPPDAVEM